MLSSGSTAAKWICNCFANQSRAQEPSYRERKHIRVSPTESHSATVRFV